MSLFVIVQVPNRSIVRLPDTAAHDRDWSPMPKSRPLPLHNNFPMGMHTHPGLWWRFRQ